jgi:hypothetical protein
LGLIRDCLIEAAATKTVQNPVEVAASGKNTPTSSVGCGALGLELGGCHEISPLNANGSDGPGKDFNGVSGSGPPMVLVLLGCDADSRTPLV